MKHAGYFFKLKPEDCLHTLISYNFDCFVRLRSLLPTCHTCLHVCVCVSLVLLGFIFAHGTFQCFCQQPFHFSWRKCDSVSNSVAALSHRMPLSIPTQLQLFHPHAVISPAYALPSII